MMNSKDFSDRWEEHKHQLQKEYPHLTSDDLAYEIGKEVELLERLAARTGKTKIEIRDWLKIMG